MRGVDLGSLVQQQSRRSSTLPSTRGDAQRAVELAVARQGVAAGGQQGVHHAVKPAVDRLEQGGAALFVADFHVGVRFDEHRARSRVGWPRQRGSGRCRRPCRVRSGLAFSSRRVLSTSGLPATAAAMSAVYPRGSGGVAVHARAQVGAHQRVVALGGGAHEVLRAVGVLGVVDLLARGVAPAASATGEQEQRAQQAGQRRGSKKTARHGDNNSVSPGRVQPGKWLPWLGWRQDTGYRMQDAGVTSVLPFGMRIESLPSVFCHPVSCIPHPASRIPHPASRIPLPTRWPGAC